jgi:hypothetical protein
VSLIERRMKEAFPGIAFDVHGTPTDIAAARDLAERDKHQFQLWACGLVNAQPYPGGRKGRTATSTDCSTSRSARTRPRR